MKKEILLMLIFFGLVFQGCENCNNTSCFTPPSGFTFELVDKSTKENLFTNETFKSSEIKVTNLSKNTNLEFDFIDEDNVNLIRISSIGWETEKVNALINVSGNDILNLIVDAERITDDCCSFTKYNESKIENAEFELNSESGVYTIFIEQ